MNERKRNKRERERKRKKARRRWFYVIEELHIYVIGKVDNRVKVFRCIHIYMINNYVVSLHIAEVLERMLTIGFN